MRHVAMMPRRSTLGDMGFSRAELEAARDVIVPDLIGPNLRLLFVGINPGLWTAATQTHFAHPGNRFYPALLVAGIIDRDIDRSDGMSDGDRAHLIERGIGITNVVGRTTAKASELTTAELRAGGDRLRAFIAERSPAVVAVAGITAYRTAFRQPKATTGEQPLGLERARLWVVPNPSGLNAHETVESLAEAYRAPAVAAGVVPA
jgi:TDG/mug DNA glycosylase family protein